jgi:hypothetical protein
MRFTPQHLAWLFLLVTIAMVPASTDISAQGGPEMQAARTRVGAPPPTNAKPAPKRKQ